MAALLATGAMVFAAHMQVPPLSQGGELAYVRDCPDTDFGSLESPWSLSCTYVSFEADEDADQILDFTSRGRFGDAGIFLSQEMPAGLLAGERYFVPVEDETRDVTFERGLITFEGGGAQADFLNGVNAGLQVQVSHATELVWTAVPGVEAELVDINRVELRNDGHSYFLRVEGGSLSVADGEVPLVASSTRVDGETVYDEEFPTGASGPVIEIRLDEGGHVRGWLGAFSATTAVMDNLFDHRLAVEA